MEEKRNSFGGTIGFVLAAAGSAVGLGNIWRFPYLAAKDGGGLFIVIYLILALTFGFTLLTTDVAIGRKTKQGPLTAYSKLHKGFGYVGVLSCLVPMLILPYYCAIGGWVIKYFIVFLTGQGNAAAADNYFTSYITSDISPIIMFLVFFILVAGTILLGVNKGIEKSSKVIMPILIILVIAIAIFSLTLKSNADDGAVRTGLEGLKILVVPDLKGLTFGKFVNVLVDAMGQLFFSLSVAMGIMIAYGSYLPKDSDLEKNVGRIELFDTAIAILAGLMIVPAVFAFSGGDQSALGKGPSLMFVTLPKVFESMGMATVIGSVFFILVLLAALTSSISIMEAIVSSLCDRFGWDRNKTTICAGIGSFLFGIPPILGYNVWDKATLGGMTILDMMDFATNSILMPICALLTCIFVAYVIGVNSIHDEVRISSAFKRQKLFDIMIKYVAPVFIVAILISSILEALGIIKF